MESVHHQMIALAFTGLLSIGTVRVFTKPTGIVLRGQGRVDASSYGLGDAILAWLLGLLFLFMIFQAQSPTKEEVQLDLWMLLVSGGFYGFLVLGVLGFMMIRNLNPVRLFGLKPTGALRLGGEALFWIAAAYPLIMFTQILSYGLAGEGARPQEIVLFLKESPSLLERGAVLLTAVVVAPVAEEFIFRGYIYGVLKRYGGTVVAMLVSAALFAAVHVHVPSLAGLFLLAIVLTVIYERTGSLWAPIAMHSAFNSIAVGIVMFFPEWAG